MANGTWLSTEPRPERVTAASHRPRVSMIGAELFKGVLIRERKRADRSNQPIVLLRVSSREDVKSQTPLPWTAVVEALGAAKRETDVMGWLKRRSAVGIILTEVSG